MTVDALAVVALCPPLNREAVGSGGLRTALTNLARASELGARVSLVVPSDEPEQLLEARATVRRMLPEGGTRLTVEGDWTTPRTTDIALATAATTAKPTRDHVKADRFVYFVQDWESWFNPVSDGFMEAEDSYRQPWEFITIGKWLRARLEGLGHRGRVTSIPFGVEVPIDVLLSPTRRHRPLVSFNYQPEKLRRLPNLVCEVSRALHLLRPDVSQAFFGSESPLPEGVKAESRGMLTEREMWDMMSSSNAVVHFSSTNPSRIPFESLACGTPCVELFGDTTLYDFPPGGVVQVMPRVADVVTVLGEILESPERYRELAIRDALMIPSRDSERDEFVRALFGGPQEQAPPVQLRRKPDFVSSTSLEGLPFDTSPTAVGVQS